MEIHTYIHTQICVHISNCWFCYIVPKPSISIDAPKIQTVGQLLRLNCLVTTVRGVTSRLDIMWNSNGVELKRTEGVIVNSTTDKSVLFIDYYIISQLSTADEDRVLQCIVKINANTLVAVNDSIKLKVTGE